MFPVSLTCTENLRRTAKMRQYPAFGPSRIASRTGRVTSPAAGSTTWVTASMMPPWLGGAVRPRAVAVQHSFRTRVPDTPKRWLAAADDHVHQMIVYAHGNSGAVRLVGVV